MTIHGIVPPLVTPLAGQNQLDTAGLERLIGRQLQAKVDGLFVLGTTGEGPGLSDSLRKEMIQQTGRIVAGKLPVYVGITDTSLVNALDLAQHALGNGAAAVVAAPPFYFPAGQTELTHWFTSMADALPLPLLLYNMPSCTKIAIETDTLRELAQHDNIIGLKDSSGDLQYLESAIAATRSVQPAFPVLIGPEALLAQAMQLGAVGGVTGGANLAPRLFTELYAAICAQDSETVERLQKTVVHLQQLYGFGKYDSSYLKGLKCAMELTEVCSGQLAAPYDAFKQPQREQVRQWLSEFPAGEYLPKEAVV